MEIHTEGLACIQQKQIGSGTFTGVRVGYASYSLVTGPSTVTFAAERNGTAGNDISITLVDPTPTIVSELGIAEVSPNNFHIALQGDGESITTTAAQLVAFLLLPQNKNLPFTAAFDTDGLVSADDFSLTGGIDYTKDRDLYRLDLDSEDPVGLFYFEPQDTHWLYSVHGHFGDDGDVTVKIVNVDRALNVISGEEVTIYNGTLPASCEFSITGKWPLTRGQAVQVISDNNGIVRVYCQRVAHGTMGGTA